MKITKIEMLRCSEIVSEWCVTLENSEFVVLKRKPDETIVSLCTAIGNIPELTVETLRVFSRVPCA